MARQRNNQATRSGQVSTNAIYRGMEDTEDFEPVRPQMLDDQGELNDDLGSSGYHPGMKTQGSYSKVGYD